MSKYKEDLEKEFDNDFLKEADFYEDTDGNFVFTKTSKENSVATQSGVGEKEGVVITGVTEKIKREIASDI